MGYTAASQPASKQLGEREEVLHVQEHGMKYNMGKTHEIEQV